MATTSTEEADGKRVSEFGQMLFVVLPLLILGGFGDTLVFILLWRWFVTPFGIKPLTFWHGFGLILLIAYIRFSSKPDEEHAERGPDYHMRRLRIGYGMMAFSFALGWLAHLLMGRGWWQAVLCGSVCTAAK
jgi:hypothetical protein